MVSIDHGAGRRRRRRGAGSLHVAHPGDLNDFAAEHKADTAHCDRYQATAYNDDAATALDYDDAATALDYDDSASGHDDVAAPHDFVMTAPRLWIDLERP
jgi:hypothetical protein